MIEVLLGLICGAPLFIDEGLVERPLSPHLEVLAELPQGHPLSAKQAASYPGRWARLRLESRLDHAQTFVIESENAVHDHLDFFLQEQNGRYIHTPAGFEHPLEDRDVISAHGAMRLTLPPKGQAEIYVRHQDELKARLMLTLRTERRYASHQAERSLTQGIFFGVLLISFVANLALLLFTRRPAYAAYSLYIFAIFVLGGRVSNALSIFQRLPLSLNHAVNAVSGPLLITAYLWFMRLFFEMREKMPKLDRVARVWMLMLVAHAGVLLLYDKSAPSYPKALYFPVWASCVLGLVFTIRALMVDLRRALPLLACVLALIGVGGTTSLFHLGLIEPGYLVRYSMYFGYELEVFLMWIALADREAVLRRERGEAIEAELAQARALERYVPKDFLECLDRRSIVEIHRGDCVEREMSILFSDIRSFTSLVEGHSAQENFQFINEYLAQIEPAIRAAGGFVDSYEGDSVMALFAGPSAGAEAALEAALGMHTALAKLNKTREHRGDALLKIGVGINTGALMLGTIGSPERLKCGVIGDPVNLAARTESLTKKYGTQLLITEHTRARLSPQVRERAALRLVDRVRVKGKMQPVTLYEVLEGLPEPQKAARQAITARLEDAIMRFQEGAIEEAIEVFAALAQEAPADPLPKLYLERCQTLLERGLPKDWDGVIELSTK